MNNSFQTILMVVLIASAVVGVFVFSGAIPLGGGEDKTAGVGTVVLWGTVKYETLARALEEFNRSSQTYNVQYIEKNPETFDRDLLEALAAGVGPDLFFLPDNLAYHYSNKIFTIPYNSYPLASFQQNFAGAGEVFLTSKGLLAFPLAVDPMVMFYNRSILDANGIVYPPKNWDEFVAAVPMLTKKDDVGRITKSAVALGHFANVAHAKDIIATLFMQLGNKIVAEKNGSFVSTLSQENKLESALTFYASFADPVKELYSWNRSFPNSREYFSTDNLAFYFGYASELLFLASRNPNQNFLVAPMPQINNSPFKLSGARVTGIAISSFSKNFNTAFIAASQMATGDFAKKFAETQGIAPVRRDLLATPPEDAFSPIFYSSALYARSWPDPSNQDTDSIFRVMVESVLSNNMTPRSALQDASSKMDLLLRR